jgi:hypothetical protein
VAAQRFLDACASWRFSHEHGNDHRTVVWFTLRGVWALPIRCQQRETQLYKCIAPPIPFLERYNDPRCALPGRRRCRFVGRLLVELSHWPIVDQQVCAVYSERAQLRISGLD